MAIGLKLKDVRRFGQRVQKGAKVFGRKLAGTAEAVGSVLTPIASAINPELGEQVQSGVQAVKKFGKSTERLAGKGTAQGEKLFKQIQQPVLGAREIAQGVKMAAKNPQQAQIMIGETVARRFPGGKNKSIQRTEGGEVNDWAPELPFAGM